eukprot:557693-Pyramimonas_sp.AAC.1
MRVSGNPSRGQPFLGCPEKQGRRRRHPQGQDPGSAASVYQHAAEHADVDPGGEGGEGGGGGGLGRCVHHCDAPLLFTFDHF